MAISITGNVVVDETSGAQTNGSTGVADATGNELIFGAGGTPAVPPAFSAALVAVAQGVPTTGALSGFSTTATAGVNVVNYGGADVTGVAFVDVNGDPLDGVDSGLMTTDGTKIFLYTYSADNNVVFGVKGDDNGTPDDPADDMAVDPETVTTQPIVFAAYLEENATGAKAWLVQYEPMYHLDATNFDDAVSPDEVIYVAVDTLTPFSLEGAPSGQNLFLMYGDGTPSVDDVTIVVTGKDPANQSEGESITTGDTVNTGQGGGGTTIGTNNQMIDPDEGMYFTFVTGANTNYTVPNLDQNEADVEANIDFQAMHDTNSAIFTVVQLQPPKEASLRLSAFSTAAEPGAAYIDGLVNDSPVEIDYIKVTTTSKQGAQASYFVYKYDPDGAGPLVGVGTTPTALGNSGVTVTFSTNTVLLDGVQAKDVIQYATSADHNRVLIDNAGGSSFDIGGFSLLGTDTTTLPFNALVFEDDGLAATGTAQTSQVDEDGLPGGNPGGYGDLDADDGVNDDNDGDETTASGNISAIFVAGADGILSYGLSTNASDIALLPTLTSKGGSVEYDVTGNTLTAYVDDGTTADYQSAEDREVFTLTVTAGTGAYAFALLDQLDHPLVNDPGTGATETSFEDDLNLQLGSILTAKDGDLDTVTAAADKLVITVDDDSPDALMPDDITVQNAVGQTAEAALGYFGNVGADEEGSVAFVGFDDGDILQGDLVGNGVAAPENILIDGSNIYLFGEGTSTLIATTSSTNADPDTNKVFVMTLNPDGSVEADDLYDIEIFQAIGNTQDVPFGSFTAAPSSGNPLTLVVHDIGGSPVDAFFSGWEDVGAQISHPGPAEAYNANPDTDPTTDQTTVNVATVGVGVGTGQDFNFDANGAGSTDDVADRIRIDFLEDDGDNALEAGEETTVNRFTFIMNQNNSPADDGDLQVRVYDENGVEVEITGILINGATLVGSGGAPVPSNDGTTVTAIDLGLGYELHGLGGGTGGSTADNDDVTIIAAGGYARIDITGIGADNAKDTFDILLKSLAVPTSFDVTFSVDAALVDEDNDMSAPATIDVTLSADPVTVTAVGISGMVEPVM